MFQAYADYMSTEEYQKGIDRLQEIALENNTVIMCSEILWWRCHRALISDDLKLKGWNVIHLFSMEKLEEHTYTTLRE